MKIAVLSGKGGTGKTFVSVNLAATVGNATYIDCDVEEPNGRLFFQPEHCKEEEVSVLVPMVTQELCNGCRKCVDFCKFNALVYIKGKLKIFEEICHSCGGCLLLCDQLAFAEKRKRVGAIETGQSRGVTVHTGIMDVGQSSGVPIIRNLLSKVKEEGTTFIDCPPGSACMVMESIRDVDYCILVAEPTIFGVHNLKMVYELVKVFQKPFGIVLNKCIGDENPAEQFCMEQKIPILCKIPYEERLGKMNSDARIAVWEDKRYRMIFETLLERVKKEAQHETTADS